MTRSVPPQMPGDLMLRIARLIFDHAVVADVVVPTIADFREELRHAGADRALRARAKRRGYQAFWMLVLLSPFAFNGWQSRSGAMAFIDKFDRIAVSLILATLVAFAGPVLGAWTIALVIPAAVVAVALHRWHADHPAGLVVDDDVRRRPEINLSSIPVGGNAGGLIFVVGSVAIVIAGLPMLRWFLAGALVAGALSAWALRAWNAAHPGERAPVNSIIAR